MSFQEMDLVTLWANEPDHDWMVGDCPDKKCSEWYLLHTKWLNEVNHRFRILESRLAKAQALLDHYFGDGWKDPEFKASEFNTCDSIYTSNGLAKLFREALGGSST